MTDPLYTPSASGAPPVGYLGSYVEANNLLWSRRLAARIEAAFPHLLADFGPGSRYYPEGDQ